MSIRSQVNARIQIPGIAVAQVDYSWTRGTEILDHHAMHVLRRRSAPSRLSVPALVGNRRVPFGHLMFFPADQAVRTDVANLDERAEVTICQFDRAWFAKAIDSDHDWSFDDIEQLLDLQNSRVDQAVQWIGTELAAPGFASTLVIESLCSFIALELTRKLLQDEHKFKVRTRDGKLLPAHLRQIMEYIDNIEGKCPTIEEMANSCGISAAHLRRAFKTTTGQTIHQYVETSRLHKARALLSETDYPLKEVSYRLGFAASSTFSSVFRKVQGETPREYRYRMRR